MLFSAMPANQANVLLGVMDFLSY